MADHPLYTNRLIHEKSPYLLQHAHNPVDWYPWSEEAFSAAKEQDKPIFLSIGYASCHWCHVMEEESFKNLELAQMMNETFINIKVDREEMPDVDSLYMEFAQAIMSGGAGWPLNLVLTPELEPFFASTYLPTDAMQGFLGMKQLVMRIAQLWKNSDEKEHVMEQASRIVDVFAQQLVEPASEIPTWEDVSKMGELLFKFADPLNGGTKGAPKFPIGFQLLFLSRLSHMTNDGRSLFYVERTLEMMYRGGIFDHIGGGFARYCVDDSWQIPHFEKMLYDNAILSQVYLETGAYTKEEFYTEVALLTYEYLKRELCDAQGAFFSSEDADTEGDEGKFYTWSWEELHKILEDKSSLFCDFYGVVPMGNFKGRNILHMPSSLKEFAEYRKREVAPLKEQLQEMRKKLFAAREKRERPPKDKKVVTAWNGLAIHSFARAGFILQNHEYLTLAEKSSDFIQKNLFSSGYLKRRWCNGESKYEAILDDYVFMIRGLLSLFEADMGSRSLELALELTGIVDAEFAADNGAYYLTNGKDPHLLLRRQEFYDGAEPSGNGVHAENLLRLYQITGQASYKKKAEQIFRAAKEHIDLYPPGACYHLLALERYYDKKAATLTIALNEHDANKEEIGRLIASHYHPHFSLIWTRAKDEALRDLIPETRVKLPLHGQTTLYICYPDRCLEPLTDIEKMQRALEKI